MSGPGRPEGEPAKPHELTVVFGDSAKTIRDGGDTSFGRGAGATIQVGVGDLHVHRVCGVFRWGTGHWELHNLGAVTTLEVQIEGGLGAKVQVGSHPLILPSNSRGTVRILTPGPYELTFAVTSDPVRVTPFEDYEGVDDTMTLNGGAGLGLTEPEHLMLVALCELRLRDPSLSPLAIPSTRHICARLGITAKRAEDLVDALVIKLAPYVDGLIGSNAGRAVSRRHQIAAFAYEIRCVSTNDLRLLDS
jgi:hypothetical protein